MGKSAEKISNEFDLITTAYHEASHTIYALLHLMRVSHVSVFKSKKYQRIHGFTYYDYPGDFESIKDNLLLMSLLKAEVGISYAGLIAEKILYKNITGSEQIPYFIRDGSAEDNKAASKTIKQYNLAQPGEKTRIYKRKLIKEVNAEIQQYWGDVIIVAHELFKNRKLEFIDLKNLLLKKTKNKKFWKMQFKNIIYFYSNHQSLDEQDLKLLL